MGKISLIAFSEHAGLKQVNNFGKKEKKKQ